MGLRVRLAPRLYRRQRHVAEEREPRAACLRRSGRRGVRKHARPSWRRLAAQSAGAAEHACSLSSCSAASSVADAALIPGLDI